MKRSPHAVVALSALLVLGLAGPRASELMAGDVEVHYLGNAGFLLSAGETKVLVDALFGDGIAGYPTLPPPLRRRVEAGTEDLSGVDLALATHRHGDHFDAAAVARHLDANPLVRFVSTEEAVARLLSVAPELAERATGLWPAPGERLLLEHAGVRVTALRLHHGAAAAQNLGLLVEIGAVSILHLGDTEVTAEELAPLNLNEEAIDVALVPYWYLLSSRLQPAIAELGARWIVVMHLPAPDAPPEYFAPAADRSELVTALRNAEPEAWVPLRAMEGRTFESEETSESGSRPTNPSAASGEMQAGEPRLVR